MKKYDVEVNVTYMPLPPEKQAAYDYSMNMLGKMLLEICARARREREQQQASDERPEDTEEQSS